MEMVSKWIGWIIGLILSLVCILVPIKAQLPIELEWSEYDGVKIPIPPKVHPRLYLRKHNIQDLKKRLEDPRLKDVWEELQLMKEDWNPEDIPEEKTWRFYVQQKGATVRAELNALEYLVTQDQRLGRKAINGIIDTLRKSTWPQVSDIARAAGRMMVTGAIVYDWCYELLTENEKQIFIKAFVRLAGMLECGYPPVKQSSVVGHSSEWMIMRDLLSAGIAIYDEFPEMYNLAASRFFREHLPVRNWFYPGHAYHQGSSYDRVRFASDLFPLWIFDRMGAGNVYHPSQQFVLYNAIYKRRPDGKLLASGDVNYPRRSYVPLGLSAMLAAGYYKDEYINYEFMLDPMNIDSRSKIFDFLWRDVDLGVKKPDDLPLTKYFAFPYEWMIARSGWGPESVIAEMKINGYNFLNHQHHDAGAFQIYYKGPLAIDAGTYQGSSGGYNSPHNKNFFKRTIAHNSLLIYDPDEVFNSMDYGGAGKTPFVTNDGGQRLPGKEWTPPFTLEDILEKDYRTGEIKGFDYGPDDRVPEYSYLKGDITMAYSNKVEEVKRSFVFLNLGEEKIPAALIVFDKIVATNPDFKKFWLLHSMEQPEIKNNETIISRTRDGDQGVLINIPLLPKKGNIEVNKIGGPGKEFWVFGKNYPNEPRPGDDPRGERGSWRVEIKPVNQSKEDYFLNVMLITDTNHITQRAEVRMIESENVIGVQLNNRVILFDRESCRLKHEFSFKVQGKGMHKILLTDLFSGQWRILKDGKILKPFVNVTNDEGTYYFEGGSGTYTLQR